MRETRNWAGLGGLIVAALVSSTVAGAGSGATTVRGRVVDADGAGVPAMLLVLSDQNQLLARRMAEADGTFALELPELPVQIVPAYRNQGTWEFEPVASRVAGAFSDLEFTGFRASTGPLGAVLSDAATGEPLAGAHVTIRRLCPEVSADPAARYRQSSIAVARTSPQGHFNVPCSMVCDTTLQFRGDARHPGSLLSVAAGDCDNRHRIEVAPLP